MNRPMLHKACACGLAVLGIFTVSASADVPPPQEQLRWQNPVSLEVAAEGADSPKAIVFPPPGMHQVSKGDVVVLQGRRKGEPDCPPVWSGDVTGGPSFAVPVTMDSTKRVTAAFNGDCAAPGGPDAFAAPDAGALHVFLGSGSLYGWFSVNRARQGVGAGITHLVSGEFPYAPVFMRPNLNFEHIMSGRVADAWRAQNTPRTDPMEVRILSPSCIEIRCPAQSSAWRLDCLMRYAYSGQHAIDMEFEVTPRANEAPLGSLVFMWASYMHAVMNRNLIFPGIRDGVEGWTEFGGGPSGGGTIGGVGQPDVKWEKGADALNLAVQPSIHFTEPVYYGLVDGDQDWETADDAMAFIMMFDSPENTRFAVWNWGDDLHSTAWDWQYVLRNPEVGRTYKHRARLVYKRFQDREDVLAEYRSWQGAKAALDGSEAATLQPFPVLFAPGENGYSPLLRADKMLESDPRLALAAYRRLLNSDADREMAAERINTWFEKKGDPAGLAAEWENITAQNISGPLPWSQLGMARLRNGEMERAVAAFGRGLELNAKDQRCRLGLTSVDLLEGRIEAGLPMLDSLVAENPCNAQQAGTACAEAAKAHAQAGRRDVAVQLYRRAMAYRPEDLGFRLQLGGLYQSMDKPTEALEQYRSIVAASPEAPYTSQLMDTVYARQGDVAGRLKEWQTLVDAHPDACIPRWHLGMALEISGDPAGAEAAYRVVLGRCPQRHEPKIWLGALIAGNGDLDGGLRQVDEAVAAMPDLVASAAEACGRSAKARVAAGDLPGALVLLRRACGYSPADLRYRVALGETLEAAGDDAAALSEYRAVVAGVPEAPHSSERIDVIYQRRGDTAGRVDEWRRLASVHPDAAMPQLHLGLALEASGDTAGARTALEKAEKINPALAEARDALGRMGGSGQEPKQ